MRTAARLLIILLPAAALAAASSPDAAEPVLNAWIRSRPFVAAAGVQPEVHAVNVSDDAVEVRSAGLSLVDLGPFQSPPSPENRVRQFVFRIPRHPAPAAGEHAGGPQGMSGVFVNGVPVYNIFEADSYQGQNIWHFDPLAAGKRSGHANSLGAIEQLLATSGRHSPIIGFAFDGYPIYGPWGFANGDGSGGLRRMRSSYRLRRTGQRTSWADRPQLTPGQYGPGVGTEFPAGAFAEDYEYAAGSGDLDEFNGRIAVTPEYPHGTYAYFLSTDASGRPAFPYLLTGRYYGSIPAEQRPQVACSGAADRGRICFYADAAHLSFAIFDAAGHPVRTLEYVHEKPMHLIVVSDDLHEFEHLHPQLVAGGRFEVEHVFRSGGHYRLYAEFTAPGAPTRHEAFALDVPGEARARVPLTLTSMSAAAASLRSAQPLRAGKDIELRFAVADRADLEPYLGAWAHVVILDEKQRHFIHAHPMEDGSVPAQVHVHSGAIPAGPPPEEIGVMTSFPEPGLYKLWLQVQQRGEVIAVPFVLRVEKAEEAAPAETEIPEGAVRIQVSASGFEPARIEAPSGQSLVLAFARSAEPNCASRVAIPSLGIVQDLPLGGVAVVRLPAQPAGDLRFACGMGMYKGMLLIR